MKTKIFSVMMSLVMGLFIASCEDDNDYAISTTPILDASSVVTGSSDVTATTATLHATVNGLENMSSKSYSVGFYYGFTQDNLSEQVSGVYNEGAISADITGLTNNTTLYYQAYVCLQSKLYYTGEVKSLVTTNAKVTTKAAESVDYASAVLGATAVDYPADATCGIVISTTAGEEAVRAGLIVPADGLAGSYTINRGGLLPNTTYYYAAYLNLGTGVVYGDVESFTTDTYEFDLDNDLVDLGLSVKWARFNVGAKEATDLGGLFAFGDLNGCNNSIDVADYPATTDTYKTAYDITNVVYGGKVTLPTAADFEELFALCTSEWTEQDGVAGYRLTGPNGNSIFLPAAGSRIMNDVTEVGAKGLYMTGTVNPTNSDFAVTYQFTSGINGKTTTARYQAVAVRPISTARNVKFDAELLYNTWEIDLDVDGSYQTFPGPTYFYGTDDSWRTITNHEPIVGDSWAWEADFAGNSWAVGGTADNCRGYMTLSKDEDGKNVVTVSQVNTDGTFTESTGTFTINEENKTLTLDIDILAPANYTDDYVNSKKTDIRILSLTRSSLQLGVIRTNDPCLLSINYIPQLEKYGYTAKLTCYGGDDAPDAWNSATMTLPGGEAGMGTYTLTFNAQAPRTMGKVYLLELEGFAAAYPNAFVRVDAIKADGEEVKFDANKFFYGDIEGKGNFRVEMANIWGCGHNDTWDGLKDTPFHPGGGETTNETALAFENTFEVTFTVVSIDADLSFTATQTAIGLNSPWTMPGNWGKETSDAISVVKENFQYKLADTSNLALTLTADECSDGIPVNGAVNLIDIVGIRSFFPGFSAELISVTNDGADVPFTASKLKTGDIEGKGNFRIELHNIWGSGTAEDPAFGGVTSVEGNNVVTSLGFTTSSVYTIGNYSSLFPLPW